MEDHRHVVCRERHVELDGVRAVLNSQLQSGQRVLGRVETAGAMGDATKTIEQLENEIFKSEMNTDTYNIMFFEITPRVPFL